MFIRLIRVQDFLHVFIVIEIGAVSRVVALMTLLFINQGQVFPRFGMAFSGPVARLTLDIFIPAGGVFRRPEPGGVAGQAGFVGGFFFFDQRLVGAGMGGGSPVLVLARMTGFAPLFPNECKERRDPHFRGGSGCPRSHHTSPAPLHRHSGTI